MGAVLGRGLLDFESHSHDWFFLARSIWRVAVICVFMGYFLEITIVIKKIERKKHDDLESRLTALEKKNP